jgi:dienelactone hydrolase
VPVSDWKLRFTTPSIAELRWAAGRPERVGVVSTESGTTQAWAWDLESGRRTLVSTSGVGAEEVHIASDGSSVLWWFDPEGDERGRWMRADFETGDSTPAFPDIPDGWMMGISVTPSATAVGIATDEAYSVWVVPNGEPARKLYEHERPAGVGREWPQGEGGLSADGRLLCIRHAEMSDISKPAARVIDTVEGSTVADLVDAGLGVMPRCWSPTPGDQRLVVTREVDGVERPWLWEPLRRKLSNVESALPGAVHAECFYTDGGALLVRHDHEARDSLWRLGFDGALERLTEHSGTITQAGIRPDGALWYRYESGSVPPRLVSDRNGTAVSIPGAVPPPGRPFEPLWFDNPSGDTIQGWLIRPDGDPPHPTIVSVHGGPEYHDTDLYDPRRLAYADHGYAVVMVNYRGSTGYGVDFRRRLFANIGFLESEDINAALDHVIERGVTDPDAVYLEGWSWGGYLAALNAGLHPERWRAVMAGIPVGDYVAAHYEVAPALRDWDVAIMGGSPMELPGLYHERNPMTYVGEVRAPILIIAGENDSRCPLGQTMVFAHALRLRGNEVAVHLYSGGHHANDVDEQVRHVELTMDWFARH